MNTPVPSVVTTNDSASPTSEMLATSPVPIVDSEILSTIPLPGEVVDSPKSDDSVIDSPVDDTSTVTNNIEDKENMTEENNTQSKIKIQDTILKYSYKEGELSS